MTDAIAPTHTTAATDEEVIIERGQVLVVERRRPRFAGQGMLRGLGVVWNHWRQSFSKLDDHSKIAGNFTTEYPEERLPLPETYRNMPVLLFDDETGQELCTSCFQCQRICPPQVIHMTQSKDPATGKAVPSVAEFIIEYDACMSCGFCAEVCPFDAIKMDHEFELSTADHPSLTVRKEALNRPVSYYESIAPTMWAEVRERAYKKLQANIKRRPGAIGIAPHLVEKIKAAQAAAPAPAPAKEQAPAKAKAPDKAPAPTAAGEDLPTDKEAKLAAIRARNAAKKAAQEQGEQPAAEAPAAKAPAGEDLPQDKAARLAAIRARNAAKKAQEQGEQPAAQEQSEQPAAETPPADDKAARLAAIRARNAAKKAQEQGEQPAAEAQSAPAEQSEQPASESQGEQPAAETPPADEKAARLAAIRARNAAKKKAQQEGEE